MLFLMILQVFALFQPANAQSSLCPPADELNRYVDTKLRAEGTGDFAGQLQLYYRLLHPFDKSKPTVLLINGGPGGDSSIIQAFSATPLANSVNLVSFDHRGLGCTRVMSKVTTFFNEPGLMGMSRAADDIEMIRKDLMGSDTSWFVYGVSYGTLLGQEYITRFPGAVRGAILDSTFDSVAAIDIGRNQYLPLFVRKIPNVGRDFDKLVALYPDLKFSILRAMRSMTYSYHGRNVDIPQFFTDLLNAPNKDEVVKLISLHGDLRGPLVGMTRQILCEEIWDFSTDTSANQYYWKALADDCSSYESIRHSLDFTAALTKLPVRVMIWGGRFDPVTPIQSMREMKNLIPNSFLWENPESGHSVLSENPACGVELLEKFLVEASDQILSGIAGRADCQVVPHTVTKEMVNFKKYLVPEAGLL